jgi:hypothetical protein
MKRLLLFMACMLFPLIVSAQTVTSYQLKTYNVGAPSPIQTYTIQASSVTCNQTVAAGGSTANPSKAVWDDTVNVGKSCVWTDPGTGPLYSVPFGGNYEATLAAINSAGTSVESIRAPFSRPGAVPPAPAGLRFIGS